MGGYVYAFAVVIVTNMCQIFLTHKFSIWYMFIRRIVSHKKTNLWGPYQDVYFIFILCYVSK